MTYEIIVFTIAAMFGILLYWRESKNNFLYRAINKITHAKELQMKSTDRKGFLFGQPILMRIIFIVVLFLIVFMIMRFLTPFNNVSVETFAALTVGTLLGTYFASLIVVANEKIGDGQESIDESIEKGKGFIKEFTKDVKEKAKELKETIEEKLDFDDDVSDVKKEIKSEVIKETPKKSGRDRLKDKGLLK